MGRVGLWPLHVPIGVGSLGFVLFCLIIAFPSIHDDVREFFGNFWEGRKRGGGGCYIRSLKIVDSIYTGQHCVALVLGATQTKTKQKSVELRNNSCTSDNTEGVGVLPANCIPVGMKVMMPQLVKYESWIILVGLHNILA